MDNFSIFIGHLNEHVVNETMLRERFGRYGHIVDLELVSRRGAGCSGKGADVLVKYQMTPLNTNNNIDAAFVDCGIRMFAFITYAEACSANIAILNEVGT